MLKAPFNGPSMLSNPFAPLLRFSSFCLALSTYGVNLPLMVDPTDDILLDNLSNPGIFPIMLLDSPIFLMLSSTLSATAEALSSALIMMSINCCVGIIFTSLLYSFIKKMGTQKKLKKCLLYVPLLSYISLSNM